MDASLALHGGLVPAGTHQALRGPWPCWRICLPQDLCLQSRSRVRAYAERIPKKAQVTAGRGGHVWINGEGLGLGASRDGKQGIC